MIEPQGARRSRRESGLGLERTRSHLSHSIHDVGASPSSPPGMLDHATNFLEDHPETLKKRSLVFKSCVPQPEEAVSSLSRRVASGRVEEISRNPAHHARTLMVGRDVRERETAFWSGALALNGERGRYHRESVRAQLFHPRPEIDTFSRVSTCPTVFHIRMQLYSFPPSP